MNNFNISDDYFMGLVYFMSAKVSNNQIGAIATDRYGLNFTFGTDVLPNSIYQTSDDLLIHAEMEALRRISNPEGAIIYINRYPCLRCVCQAIHLGVKRIVYRGQEINGWKRIQEVASTTCLHLDEFKGSIDWLRDNILFLESQDVFCN